MHYCVGLRRLGFKLTFVLSDAGVALTSAFSSSLDLDGIFQLNGSDNCNGNAISVVRS